MLRELIVDERVALASGVWCCLLFKSSHPLPIAQTLRLTHENPAIAERRAQTARREVDILRKLCSHDHGGANTPNVIEVFQQDSRTYPRTPVYYVVMEM